MPSNHPRAAALIAAGLYRNLSAFPELEERIAALPEEIVRGDGFEVFVEGTSGRCPCSSARISGSSVESRLASAVPSTCPRTQRASTLSSGRRSPAGHHLSSQVSHRAREAGRADVATFLGLTERASDRLLVSNANRCATDVENRDGLCLLRGSDFDELSVEILSAIAACLEGRPAEQSRAVPREDQTKALACVGNALLTRARDRRHALRHWQNARSTRGCRAAVAPNRAGALAIAGASQPDLGRVV
jgi:hypothetical protein